MTSRSRRATVRRLDGLASHMEARCSQRRVTIELGRGLRVEEVGAPRSYHFNPSAAETVWFGKTR